MIEKYKLRNTIDIFVFVLINILFSDLFAVVYLIEWFLFSMVIQLSTVNSLITCFVVFIGLAMIFFLFRYLGLILIYNFFEKKSQNRNITNFIHKLRENSKLQRNIWLLTWLSAILIPLYYFIDIYLKKGRYIEFIVFMILGVMYLGLLAFNSFAALFYYWKVSDNNKHKNNVGYE